MDEFHRSLLGREMSVGFGLLAFAAVLGLFVNAAGCAVLVAAPALYPQAFRATGVGLAVGIGRSGAILPAAVVGLLVSRGWNASSPYPAFAIPMAIGFVVAVAVAARSARRSRVSA